LAYAQNARKPKKPKPQPSDCTLQFFLQLSREQVEVAQLSPLFRKLFEVNEVAKVLPACPSSEGLEVMVFSSRARCKVNRSCRLEAAVGIEPTNKGFADLCLTTWLRRLDFQRKGEGKLNLPSP
jgi:hypothetical protein